MNNNMNLAKWNYHGWEAVKWFSYFVWFVGSVFSYVGVTSNTHMAWWMKVIAAGFAVGINIIEFMFNNMSLKELTNIKEVGDVILIFFGVIAYVYDVWTNILGFAILMIGTANLLGIWKADWTLLVWPVLFGLSFAIAPEPMYVKYLRNRKTKPKSAIVAPVSYQERYNRDPKPVIIPSASATNSVTRRPGEAVKEYIARKYGKED